MNKIVEYLWDESIMTLLLLLQNIEDFFGKKANLT